MTQDNPFYPAMIEAVQQTLENMVFMEVIEERGTPTNIPTAELTWSSMLINDPVQGEIRLAMPAGLLKKISGNVFGIDEEDVTTSQADDIINELLNTIGGLFMTKLFPNQEYQIGLPSLAAGKLLDVDEHTVIWHLINDDEEPLKIYADGESLIALHQKAE
jgi:hypothetical protein